MPEGVVVVGVGRMNRPSEILFKNVQRWWCILIVPALGRQKWNYEFGVRLSKKTTKREKEAGGMAQQ